MADLWYVIIAGALTIFVLLDGYDFGAGMLHRFVARTDDERRQVIAAIGPFWDGNEVWLLAAGGALFLAFPKVLSAGLSGFYFAIFLVLWCLIGRGLALEFRSHVADRMWRSFFDTLFMATSVLLALFFGVALANIVRGVPLSADGWFSLELFTRFRATPPVGILDWYTIAIGLFAVGALAVHGGTFLALRTDGVVRDRSRVAARRALIGVVVAWPVVTWATAVVRPGFFDAFASRPLAWLFVLIAVAGTGAAYAGLRNERDGLAFAGSVGFVGGLLGATAACAWPALLYSVSVEANSLTTVNAAAPADGLRTAFVWYLPGMLLAVGYYALLTRLHNYRAHADDYGSHG